jgi:hypothetical protein
MRVADVCRFECALQLTLAVLVCELDLSQSAPKPLLTPPLPVASRRSCSSHITAMSARVWARRAIIVTGVGVGSAALMMRFMPNQETAPLRNPSIYNWINLGADKIYFHFGRTIRKFIDAESAHNLAIRVAASPRHVRGILGLLPPQYDYENLHSEPFTKQQQDEESGKRRGKKSATADVPLKKLHFANPVGLAAGFDKNAEVRLTSIERSIDRAHFH